MKFKTIKELEAEKPITLIGMTKIESLKKVVELIHEVSEKEWFDTVVEKIIERIEG